ncbi:MAG: hypothetical protein MJ002_08865 [Paludibacteraceae bacterium]|nr:hypothetical protein [Paludibacteraceae bacterium]
MKNNIKTLVITILLLSSISLSAQSNDNWFNNGNANNQYGNVSTTTTFDRGNHSYATNDFLSDYEAGDWSSIPGRQRVRKNTNLSDPNRTQEEPAPVTDGIPVLMVMLLGVAVLKYRKSH